MVAGVIRLTALLFNHNTLRAAIASWDLRMHIVFSIVAEGKLAFPIVKCFAADLSGQRVAVPLLNGIQNHSGFPQWRLGARTRGRIVGERHVAREKRGRAGRRG